MLIDWFTVAAQIVNFLVLVALLRHFLFRRLIEAMDNRERRIAGRLAEAVEKNREADRKVEETRALGAEQERRRVEMLSQAKQEADEQRKEMLQEAREAVRKIEARWRQDLEREQAAFFTDLRRRASSEILAIVRRALADLAGADLEHCALEVFLGKLQSIDTISLRQLASGAVTVLSAAELPADVQRKIQSALEERLAAPVQMQFTPTPAMSWGVELRGSGRRLAWTSDSYLDALEDSLRVALERRATVSVA